MSLVILDEQLESIQLSDEVRKKALQKVKEGYVMTLLEVGERWKGSPESGYGSKIAFSWDCRDFIIGKAARCVGYVLASVKDVLDKMQAQGMRISH